MKNVRGYGFNRTIHRTEHVDVEIGPEGTVVAVWFRCQMLPFEEHRVDAQRATEMLNTETLPGLKAVYMEDDE